jgi:hypothetical protein
LAVLALAPGCGGGDDADSQAADPVAALLADAEANCIANGEGRAQIHLSTPPPRSAKAEAALTTAIVERNRQDLEGLQALTAPEEIAAEWERFLAPREQLIEINERAAGAYAEHGYGAGNRAGAPGAAVDARENEAADELGLAACAENLPPEQDRLARETAELVQTGTDPKRICEEVFLPDYLDSLGGSAPDCQRYFERSEVADSIEVEDVQGTEDGVAQVVAVDAGGPYDGERVTATMVYDDGIWRVWDLAVG